MKLKSLFFSIFIFGSCLSIYGAADDGEDRLTTTTWLLEGVISREAQGNFEDNQYIFDQGTSNRGFVIRIVNFCPEPLIFEQNRSGLYMNYGRCTRPATEFDDQGQRENSIIPQHGVVDWHLSNKKCFGPSFELEYISQAETWGIRILGNRDHNGGNNGHYIRFVLSPSASRYISVEQEINLNPENTSVRSMGVFRIMPLPIAMPDAM